VGIKFANLNGHIDGHLDVGQSLMCQSSPTKNMIIAAL
jgi:hypothetical protein